ncbi:MAG: hypothetical protein LBI49_10005 [Nocardiopsaceae bacterium]|jgi:hypothetical protein|nr:hypothetical protein [Nocardiopsaceae bacterium]
MRRRSVPGASPGTSGARPGAHRAARVGAGGPAADLGSIRHTDTLLDLLAARRLGWSSARRDPAVTVLRALTADVDAPAAATAGAAPGTAQRGRAGWARPVTSAAVIAGSLAALMLAAVASITGLMAAGMIVRLVRLGAALPDGSGGPAGASRHGPGRRELHR